MTKPWVIHVVDDDEQWRSSLVFVLQTFGFATVNHADGSDFLRHPHNGCDLLITDLRMPGMNGIELANRLRTAGSSMPIILVSGSGDRSIHDDAIDAGIDLVLEKPVELIILLAEIEKVTMASCQKCTIGAAHPVDPFCATPRQS